MITTSTAGPFGATGVLRAPKGVITDMNSVTTEDLERDVFNTPLDTLENLWLTRFGNEWVDIATIEDDVTFRLVFRRLYEVRRLEMHYLTDRARFVCRKPT